MGKEKKYLIHSRESRDHQTYTVIFAMSVVDAILAYWESHPDMPTVRVLTYNNQGFVVDA